MDSKKTVAEYFCLLRGERSREQVARSLKVSASALYKWERAVSQPEWQYLINYLKLNKMELPYFLYSHWPDVNFHKGHQIIDFFIKQYGVNVVAEVVGLSRNGLVKLMNTEGSPKAHIIFSLWHHYSRVSFLVFLDCTVSLSKISAFSKLGSRWETEYSISEKYPFVAGIIYKLVSGLEEKQAPILLAKYFGGEPEEIKEILDRLIEADIICFSDGRYFLEARHVFDSRGNFEVNKKLRKYWIERALNALDLQRDYSTTSFFNYSLMNLSKGAYEEVLFEYQKFNSKVRRIVADDVNTEKTTHILNTQFVNFEDFYQKNEKS